MRIKNNRGFTLLELIVSMSVMVLVLVLAFSYFLYNTKLYTVANNEANIQFDCTQIMEILTVAAKESSHITTGSGMEYVFTRDGGNISLVFDDDANTLTINDTVYENISFFEINEVAGGSKLREIVIAGKRGDQEKRFETTISMRN